MLKNFHAYDKKIITFMKRYGETVELMLLGGYFIWFGLLKLLGEKSASSIMAKSVYWFDPSWVVPTLGVWEILIGLSLIIKKWHRLAIFLLFIRVPGSFLAMVYHYSECFDGSIFTPTIQGQYLIKELTLIGAALVIGSSIEKKNESST